VNIFRGHPRRRKADVGYIYDFDGVRYVGHKVNGETVYAVEGTTPPELARPMIFVLDEPEVSVEDVAKEKGDLI
jgi:hypothetical protein